MDLAEYDIFLSHSSADRAAVESLKAQVERMGYSVFADWEAAPHLDPRKVTEETAGYLRKAMGRCSALLFALSGGTVRSRWMPWELGFFDGRNGRVFIVPLDDAAELAVRGHEYVGFYALVRRDDLADFLERKLPRAASSAGVTSPVRERPLINPAAQAGTIGIGDDLRAAVGDPLRGLQFAAEIMMAWWRLWGLAPAPERWGRD